MIAFTIICYSTNYIFQSVKLQFSPILEEKMTQNTLMS